MRAQAFVAAGGALLAAAALLGVDSAPTSFSAKTDDVTITARLLTEKEALIKAVGSDLNRQYVIVELTVTPRGGYPVTLSRDDFLLRSERDNERSTADSPDRVAGSATLVLGATDGRGPIRSESGDPIFIGGIPGTGTGLPQRIGTQNGTFGNSPAAGSTTLSSASAKETPLLSRLQKNELPMGEIRKPVSGYLYFPIDPKQKPKNFHLHFRGPGGNCELRFK